MTRLPPRSTLFPYTTLFRSSYTPATSLTEGVTIGPDGHPVVAGSPCYPPCGFRAEKYDGATGALLWSTVSDAGAASGGDRKSTRLNSSHLGISYAVFCLKKK